MRFRCLALAAGLVPSALYAQSPRSQQVLREFLESTANAVVRRQSIGSISSASAKAEFTAVEAYDPGKPKEIVRGMELRLRDGRREEFYVMDPWAVQSLRGGLQLCLPAPPGLAGCGMVLPVYGVNIHLEQTPERKSVLMFTGKDQRDSFRFSDRTLQDVLGPIAAYASTPANPAHQ